MTTNTDAERSILGSMLLSKKAVQTVTERMRVDDFGDPCHREIYSAMMTLALSSTDVDLVTLDAELTRRGKLEAVGGPSYLIDLSQSVPTTANVGQYVKIAIENANKRRLQLIAESINRKAAGGDLTTEAIIELVENACSDITLRKEKDGGWKNLGDAVLEAYTTIENPVKRVTMGFKELDEMMCGGLTKSELTIVGARPGQGKSAFMLAVGMNAAEAGNHVGFVSLEMSTLQIAQRALAATSTVSITKQRKGKGAMTDGDWDLLADGMNRIGELGLHDRFHIYEGYGMTIERLSNITRHAVKRGELDLLIVDYIQLLRTTEKTSSDFERLGKISKGLKQLALTLNIPILTAAQVLRQGKDDTKKGGRAPALDELRGSGDLEQDADNVLLIHSPNNPDDPTLKDVPPEHQGIYERALFSNMQAFTVQVAKQRQGATGRTWCLFKPQIMRFYEDKE